MYVSLRELNELKLGTQVNPKFVMNHSHRVTKLRKKQIRVSSQLPQLVDKAAKSLRSQSQLFTPPINQQSFKIENQVPNKFLKHRFIKKDMSTHTSCSSAETADPKHAQEDTQFSDGFKLQTPNVEKSWILSNQTSQRDLDQQECSSICCEEDDFSKLSDQLQGSWKFEDFQHILPLKINSFTVKQITWSDFSSTPVVNSQWKAHTYWTVGYTYEIKMRKMKKQNAIRYRLVINSSAQLTNRCWVRNKWDRLLEHETGHYIIGCLCALEFKKRADKEKFTNNYRMEAQKLFNSLFQEYLVMERKYDHETEHSRDINAQKRWNARLIEELQGYQAYFGDVQVRGMKQKK